MKFYVALEVCGEISADSYEEADALARGMLGSLKRAAQNQTLDNVFVEVGSIDADETGGDYES